MALLALVRPVSASFADALATVRPDPPLDVARARVQHAAYVEALRRAGADVVMLPALDADPTRALSRTPRWSPAGSR